MIVRIVTIEPRQSGADTDSGTLYDVSAAVDGQPYTFTVSIEDVGPEGDKIRTGNFVGRASWEILARNAYFVTEICKLTFAVHGHRPVALPVSLEEPQL